MEDDLWKKICSKKSCNTVLSLKIVSCTDWGITWKPTGFKCYQFNVICFRWNVFFEWCYKFFILFKNVITDLWKRVSCHICRTIEVRLEAPETAVVILNTQATGPFHNIQRIFYLIYFYIFLRVPCHFLYCRRLLSSQLWWWVVEDHWRLLEAGKDVCQLCKKARFLKKGWNHL